MGGHLRGRAMATRGPQGPGGRVGRRQKYRPIGPFLSHYLGRFASGGPPAIHFESTLASKMAGGWGGRKPIYLRGRPSVGWGRLAPSSHIPPASRPPLAIQPAVASVPPMAGGLLGGRGGPIPAGIPSGTERPGPSGHPHGRVRTEPQGTRPIHSRASHGGPGAVEWTRRTIWVGDRRPGPPAGPDALINLNNTRSFQDSWRFNPRRRRPASPAGRLPSFRPSPRREARPSPGQVFAPVAGRREIGESPAGRKIDLFPLFFARARKRASAIRENGPEFCTGSRDLGQSAGGSDSPGNQARPRGPALARGHAPSSCTAMEPRHPRPIALINLNDTQFPQ